MPSHTRGHGVSHPLSQSMREGVGLGRKARSQVWRTSCLILLQRFPIECEFTIECACLDPRREGWAQRWGSRKYSLSKYLCARLSGWGWALSVNGLPGKLTAGKGMKSCSWHPWRNGHEKTQPANSMDLEAGAGLESGGLGLWRGSLLEKGGVVPRA